MAAESVQRLPSINSSRIALELSRHTPRRPNLPLRVDTSLPAIIDTSSSGFPTSSTISPSHSPCLPRPPSLTKVLENKVIASVPFPRMVDNIHDTTLEDPFSIQTIAAYETMQLQATKNEVSSTAAEVSKFGLISSPEK